MARPTLTEIAEAVLRARPSATTAELAADAVARRATRAKDPAASMRRAVQWDLRFVEVRPDTWVLTTRIAASPVTHRITTDEAASDTLGLGIDLATLGPFVIKDLMTADGTRLQVLRGRTAALATGVDAGVALRGPAGWPGFEAGELVEVSLDGTAVHVRSGREPAAADRMRGRRLVALTRAALERAAPALGVGPFVEVLEVLALFAADDPDALATPLPPLSEVLDGTGLVSHHGSIGLPETDWAMLDGMLARMRRQMAPVGRAPEDELGDGLDEDDDGASDRPDDDLPAIAGAAGAASRPMPPALRLLPGRDDAGEPPGFDDRILSELIDWHGLPEDEALTLGVVLDLFVVWNVPGSAGSPPSASTTMRRGLAELLSAPRVALAIADYATTDPRVEGFARDLAAATANREEGGGPAYLLGAIAESRGDLAEAERRFREAVALDPWCVSAQIGLLEIEIDRGDYAAAAARMRRLEFPADDADYRWVADRLAPAVARVGRNDPCPCGSGRKYKACHLDRPAATAAVNPVEALEYKLARFIRRPDPGRALETLIHGALVPELADDPEAAADEVHADDWLEAAEDRLLDEHVAFTSELLVYERGWIHRFLELRGSLLPEEERRLAEQWTSSRVRLYEVVATSPGQGVVVRDLVAGGPETGVHDTVMSRGLKPLDLALMRLRPNGRGGLVPSAGASIPRQRRLEAEGLVRRGDVPGMLRLLAVPEPRPLVQTVDGDPLVFVTITYELPDPAAARTALARQLDEHEPGRFVAMSPTRAHSTTGSIEIDGTTATLTAASIPRADALAQTLEAAVPGARRVERSERRVEDLLATPDPGGHRARRDLPPPSDDDDVLSAPGAREAVDAVMRGYEAAWVDDHIPVLGGRTPRAAIRDPAGRRDVEALLDDMAWMNARAAAAGQATMMDPDRIRDLLGLPRPPSRR